MNKNQSCDEAVGGKLVLGSNSGDTCSGFPVGALGHNGGLADRDVDWFGVVLAADMENVGDSLLK